MRTLAIDLGTKRIGVALSDESGRFASPLEVLHVKSVDAAIEPIARIIAAEGVARVVVGLPLNMDGSIGAAARATVDWAKGLMTRINRPIVFVDERLSSFDAEQRLAERKRDGERITRKRRKESLDALAAAGFLQQFLDGKLSAIEGIV